MRQFGLGCVVGLVLALLLAVLWSIWNAGGSVPPSSPPEPVEVDLEVRVDESALTRLAGEQLRESPMAVQDVTVDVHPGGALDIDLDLTLEVFGFETVVKAKAAGAAFVTGGQLRFELQEVSLAGIAMAAERLPAGIDAEVRTLVDKILAGANDSVAELDMELVGLASDERSLKLMLQFIEPPR